MNPRILHHKVVMVPHALIIYESEVSITVLCLLCSSHYTAVRIKNCLKSTSVIKVTTMKNTIVPCPSYHLKLKCVSIALLCQLRSTHYIAARIKNCLKSTSVIKVPLWKIQMISITQRKPPHAVNYLINTFQSLSAKMNGAQRSTLVNPWRMHCMYCGMPKGTSWAEATSNSEKIKLVALAVIELRLSEGIRQAVS